MKQTRFRTDDRFYSVETVNYEFVVSKLERFCSDDEWSIEEGVLFVQEGSKAEYLVRSQEARLENYLILDEDRQMVVESEWTVTYWTTLATFAQWQKLLERLEIEPFGSEAEFEAYRDDGLEPLFEQCFREDLVGYMTDKAVVS